MSLQGLDFGVLHIQSCGNVNLNTPVARSYHYTNVSRVAVAPHCHGAMAAMARRLARALTQ